MDERDFNRILDQAKPSCAQKEAMLDRLLHEERKVKPMKKLKKLTVLAVAAALMVVSAAAANPEGVKELFNNISSVIQFGQYRQDYTMPDGETFTVFSTPVPSVESRNGRAILVIDGKDAADITAALQAEGRYTYDMETEEGQLHILVEGTVEEWTASVLIGEPGENAPLSTITSRSNGSGESSSPAYEVPFADDSEEGEDLSPEDLALEE